MSPRLALMIGGVAGVVFGLALFVSPESMLAGFGLATPVAAKVLSRDVGATLIGLGLINWMARNAAGEALRALLVGNVIVQALELLINGYEIVVAIFLLKLQEDSSSIWSSALSSSSRCAPLLRAHSAIARSVAPVTFCFDTS